MKNVEIFCDGSCLGNPGPGGYGVILRYNEKEKELSQGYKLTTNNRMELLAAITALEALKEKVVATIYTDSNYVLQGMTMWIYGWKKAKRLSFNSKNPVKNIDLWLRLDKISSQHEVIWKKVKGHSGHEENERCDKLAKNAASSKNLLDDEGFSD